MITANEIDLLADVIYRKQERRDGWPITREELALVIKDALRPDPDKMSGFMTAGGRLNKRYG